MAPIFTGNKFGFGRVDAAAVAATPALSFSATGGTTSTPGDGYKYHVFTHPNSSNFVVSGNGAPVVNTTIDVLLQGAGGGGGGGDGGGGNSDGGCGGGGGATGVWSIPITVSGTYAVSVGPGGSGGGAGGGIGPSGSLSQLTNAVDSTFIQAGGGTGGNPRPNGTNVPGGTISNPWYPASTSLSGGVGNNNTGFSGGPGGSAGGGPAGPGPWWWPYMAPGVGGNGAPHSGNASGGSTYGGGGGAGPGSFDGGGSGPGAAGGAGRVVIRYLL